MKKRLLTTLIIWAVIAAIALPLLWWQTRPDWPDFSATDTTAPQVIVRVDRDYAYHIGDLIAVELFIKESPGSIVDPKTVTVGGDFELNSIPEFTQSKTDDGIMIHRILLKVQTFQAQPQGVLKTAVGYKQADKRLNLEIPDQSLYWSNTYDGREHLQEGEDARLPVYLYAAPFALSLAFACITFAVLCFLAVRKYLASRPRPVVDWKRKRVVELMSLIEADKATPEIHLELDGLVRDRFKVGPIPASHLNASSMNSFLYYFLTLNSPAIYSEDELDEEHRLQLLNSAKDLLAICW